MQREEAVGVSFREADGEVAFEPRTERRYCIGCVGFGGSSHVTGRRVFAHFFRLDGMLCLYGFGCMAWNTPLRWQLFGMDASICKEQKKF